MNQIEEQVQQKAREQQQDPSMMSNVGAFIADSADDILCLAIDNGAALVKVGGEVLSGAGEMGANVLSGVGDVAGAVASGVGDVIGGVGELIGGIFDAF